MDYIRILYRNNKDLGKVCYQTGNWYQEIFIDGDLTEPDVKDIDIVNRTDGIEVLDEAITQEIYTLKFMAYPFVWRALKLLRMHSDIMVIQKNGEILYPKNVKVGKPDWESQGEVARLTLQFIVESTVKRNTLRNML